MRGTSALGLLALCGCGSADFAAALHVRIEGQPPTAGGGYWIELRQPDGDTIEGVSKQFVAFAPGDQDVTVVLENDGFFAGNDTRLARLVVGAVPQRDASPAARGSRLLEIRRGVVEELTLTLVDDPRPLTAELEAELDIDFADSVDIVIKVDPSSLPTADGFVFDLWYEGGDLQWIARLGQSLESFNLNGLRQTIRTHGLGFVVTAEPDDSPESLKRSVGWAVLRGEMNDVLVDALVVSDDTVEGTLAAMMSTLDTAEQHIGFAANDNSQGNLSGVRMHTEHVFATLGGAAVAEATTPGPGLRGDFDSSGSIMYVHSNRVGIGTNGTNGFLGPLVGGLSTLEATHDVAAALTCAANTRDANVDALAAVEGIAGEINGGASSVDVEPARIAVELVRGEDHDPGNSSSPDQTTLCLIAELEAEAAFSLDILASGVN